MSDNVRLTDHDKVLAADEIGDAKHLRVKLQYGDNNSATDVSATNPLPVDIGGGSVNINRWNSMDITTINEFNFQLGRTINGVSDIFTVAMAPTSANTKVLADLSWFEIV